MSDIEVDGVEGETGEAGGEVTYVGGRAIEQSTEGETPDGDHGDELAAAKAAVKLALQEEGKKAAKETKEHLAKDPMAPRERGPDGKFVKDESREDEEDGGEEGGDKPAPAKAPSKPAKAVQDEAAEEASQLRKVLQERKETARFKAEAAAEVEKLRNEARTFYQQLQQEKAELAREKQRIEMLRKDPLRAIKENGWDPEEFILDIANDGTPEGQARRAQRELQQSINELHDWKAQQAAQLEEQKVQQANAQKAQFRNQIEQEFLRTAGARTPEGTHKNPHLVAMYKDTPEDLVDQADRVAEKYRKATGQEATFGEIAEYLEERAHKWYKSLSSGSAPQAGAPVTKGKPTPGNATGKRSLSPSGSSERRSLGNTLKDLDGDERREAAMEAVRAAIHASGGRD